MSNRTRRKARASAAEGSRRRLQKIAVVGVLGAVVVAGVLILRAPSEVPGAGVAARGGDAPVATNGTTDPPAVVVIKGGVHTVDHSTAPLPSAVTPRVDGRPTLVWFSGTWCEICELMEPYVGPTIAQFDGRMAFAEKSVDHDRSSASKFGIRGTPTFLLIDAQGRDAGRFFYQPDGVRLGQTIEAALTKIGAWSPREFLGLRWKRTTGAGLKRPGTSRPRGGVHDGYAHG